MANKLILKRSSVAAKVPLTTDLEVGELAVNLADAKLYTKNSGGTVIELGGGGGGISDGDKGDITVSSSGSVWTIDSGVISTTKLGGDITTAGKALLDDATAAAQRTTLGATTLGSNLFTIANPSAITFPRFNADNTVSSLSATNFRTAIGAGTGNGTVTSVTGTSPVASSGGGTPAISLSANYGDTLNPYASKTAKFVLAAPNAANGVPTFRAIVASDIPTLNQNTTGTAANVTGTVAVANGGTGATTLTANNVLLGNGTSALQVVAPGTSGNVLTSNGTTWISATAPLTFASSAENAAGTVEGKAVDPLGIREAFNATGSAPVYACRAWVNFNGTGTVAIRASGNVSSITDNGAGDYKVNFTTAMPDAKYAVCGSSGSASAGNYNVGAFNYLAGSVNVANWSTSNAQSDQPNISVAIFR